MSTRSWRPATILVLAIALSACGAAGSRSARPGDSVPTPATGTVTATATPTTDAGGLAHPTGANEIVLRFDEAGGFVPVEWTAAHVPYFTLYGDGRVVFVRTSAVVQPAADGAIAGMPVRTAVLSEEQVQDRSGIVPCCVCIVQILGDGIVRRTARQDVVLVIRLI